MGEINPNHVNSMILFSRFGTMHVFCTNVILWIRTLIKESLLEIDESEEEAHRHEHEEGVEPEAKI